MQFSRTQKIRDGQAVKLLGRDARTGRWRLVEVVHEDQLDIFGALEGATADRLALTDDLAPKSGASN